MSALGQKRTSESGAQNVRFTPESGHYSALHQMSAFSQKRTSAKVGVPHLRFGKSCSGSMICDQGHQHDAERERLGNIGSIFVLRFSR